MNYFRRADKPDDPPGDGAGGGDSADAVAASPDAENMPAQTDAGEDGAPHPEGGDAGDSASANEGGEAQAALLEGILDAPEDPHSDEHSEGGSDGSYTDDSEYTYVTDDDDDDEGPKKGGWFGFLRRGKKAGDEEEEISESENEGENEGEPEILEVAAEAEESESSDDEHLAHPLLHSSAASPSIRSPLASPATVQAREAEEAALLAAAIRRVQRRIDSKGGTLYDALSEQDRQLVDSLRGVKDEGTIQEAVARSMEAEFRPPDLDAEEGPMVHEPVAEVEPFLHVENGSTAAGAGAQAGDAMGEMNGGEEDAPEEAGDETTDEECDDDDDDEQPTIEEQRSLLSLAAEHDRVDVLQELLRGPSSENPALFASLLAGISHDGEDKGGADAAFVPPPLHAAVAHGAANAASCLLRMGADPSLRPMVPAAYRSHGYQPYRRSGSGVEEDRNFQKYHGMSAWELAFGSTIVVDGDGEAEDEAAEESTTKGGWFGFGSSKIEPAPAAAPAAAATGQPRTKKKAPLNISPAKREGIRHAFTAEALRAIGSDEVDRLCQLLDAGMAPETEAAGKTLGGWARELDAKGCCELLRAQSADDEAGPEEVLDEKGEEEVVEEAEMNGPTQTARQPTAMQDARLAGMSLADARALVRESQASIPPLTACRDDLAAEASFHRSILKDVAATDGRDGLNSQSLIEVVRALKDRRAEAEEAAEAWQRAWEEREDELDFFWEEVLSDELRGELSGVLNSVSADPNLPIAADGATDGIEEWTKRFVEVDNYVNALRTSIASLAEESSRSMAEIERLGMGGALALTGKLKDEVKETEKNMALAQAGETLCRRKIEIIQRRLDRGPAVKENGIAPQEIDGDEEVPAAMGSEGEIEDYQLRAVVEQEKVHQPEVSQTKQPAEAARDVVSSSPSPTEAQRERDTCLADEVANSESDDDETGSSADGRSTGDDSEETDDVDEEDQGEMDHADREEENEGFVEVQRPDAANGGVVNPSADQAAPKTDDVKPSEAIKEGMSTALVVHSPNPQASSLSSQLWEIIRRIVGLGRATPSYNDSPETNPTIMIV